MGFYDINYNAKAWQSLPIRLRQAVHYAWVKVLISPVVYLAGLFKTNRDANVYELAHNGQVCYLEAILNDTFDPLTRSIYIDDPAYIDPLFLFPSPDEKPVYLGLTSEAGSTVYPDPQWFYLQTELYSGGGVQFIVHDSGVVYDTHRMRALIDKYRLMSKTNYLVLP